MRCPITSSTHFTVSCQQTAREKRFGDACKIAVVLHWHTCTSAAIQYSLPVSAHARRTNAAHSAILQDLQDDQWQ